MAISVSPKEVCTATAAMLSEDSCLADLVWFDYAPTSLGTVFNRLPAGVVDFAVDSAASFDSEYVDQSHIVSLTLTIEMFVPVRESDTNGQQADQQVWRYWWCLVNRLNMVRYLGKTVDKADIIDGNVEGIPLETKETGLVVRYAWLALRVDIQL